VTASSKPSQVFRFGVFELDGRARELRRQGVRVRLQEQPFLVLSYLLERAGGVVTRDELRQKLWPSSVYVDFDHGLNNAIARVREVLGDSATTPRYVETLPKLGYRFIYPVDGPAEPAGGVKEMAAPPEREPAAAKAPSQVAPPQTEPNSDVALAVPRRFARTFSTAAAVAVAVVLGLAVGLWLAQRPSEIAANTTVTPPKVPSVAVLPFVNLSSDPENEFVADGLSEELLHKLAGIRGLNVAGRTASFAFKGTTEAPAVIAQKLNVTHLLEGSIRRSEQRLRITAQLIDAASGYHLWSEVFDRDSTDIFEIQEEIARAVATAMQVKLLTADHAHLSRRLTDDAEAYRQYLIARAQISWVFGRPDWAVIKRSYEAAIEHDPEFAAAHAGLSHFYFNRGRSDEELRLGREAAERAVALDPDLSEALSARASWDFRRYLTDGDYEAYRKAIQGYRRALEIDPANGQAAFHYARAVVWTDPELAPSLFERTLELDPMRYSAAGFGAFLVSRRGEHDTARRRLAELYEQNPGARFHVAIFLATHETDLGRLDEAVRYQQEAQGRGDVGALSLWTLYMSLGDRAGARALVDQDALGKLGEAARSVMNGRYDKAFATLDRSRATSPGDHYLDVPLARLALITGNAERAREILEPRLPGIVKGVEPIDGRNVLPVLDLVAAWSWSGDERAASELLGRSVAFLDGPSAPRWPRYVFLRARAHSLAGELDAAQLALDRAYSEGFRTTWGVDVAPRPFDYFDPVDADPAFAALRKTPGYQAWLKRTEADNARQLARLKSREATDAPRVAVLEDEE
jgi:TolB-like protein/DNA-binding winged helix-turn-helix (wHTH) protein/Tfp pilus assembly protein PilF